MTTTLETINLIEQISTGQSSINKDLLQLCARLADEIELLNVRISKLEKKKDQTK